MPLRDDSSPVPGTRDRLPSDLNAPRWLEGKLRDFLSSYGYLHVDVPVLDRTDVYLRKLGSRVAAHMFTFADQQGEDLCLRPEFTGSVIRTFIDHATELSLPVRWQYCGPVFRDWSASQYLGPRAGQARQFTQIGVEIIGPSSPRSDAELLAVAQRALPSAGLPAPRTVVGHAGLVHRLLNGLDLSERVRVRIASRLASLREGPAAIASLREELAEIMGLPPERATAGGLFSGVPGEEAAAMVRWLLSEGITRPTGRRTPDEILLRFQSKLQARDDPEAVDRALALAAALAPVKDEPDRALAEGRKTVTGFGLNPAPIEELQMTLSHLAAYGLGSSHVMVDLGLTRPLGYYTGIVFEMFIDGGSETPVGGGGRYDGLVRALGGPDVPALGFAYSLETLIPGLSTQADQSTGAPAVLVVPSADGDLPAALGYLDRVRGEGRRAVLDVMDQEAQQRLDYCRKNGISRVVLIHGDRVEETELAGASSYAAASAS